jgi:carbamoyltransferase
VPTDRILFCTHHDSHAASAFFASPFEQAAILTADGVGEWTTTAIGRGRGANLELTHEIRFPHSIGLLYSAFTAFLGFEVNEGEYKVMGMAAYGTPRYVDRVWKLVRLESSGAFALDLDYFSFHYSGRRTFGDRFVDLFGPPRDPGMPFRTKRAQASAGAEPSDDESLAARNQYYADLAASIQRVTEEIVLAQARAAVGQAGCTALCIAGGVALNSVANGRILRETPVTELFVQPAAGDGGAALGAALYAYHVIFGHPRVWAMEHASWGASFGTDEARTAAAAGGLPWHEFDAEEELLDEVVERLLRGQVIGWAQGRFEFGPRALGHRSIIADPRSAAMKDLVNTRIKFREPFRPFAPSVLVERAGEFFDLAAPARCLPARFMLVVVPVRDPDRVRIPAVTHADGTARPHTVVQQTNPRYHRLIEKFGAATATPVLLNTSLNLAGEPIVNSPDEAMSALHRSGMDALVLDRILISKVA